MRQNGSIFPNVSHVAEKRENLDAMEMAQAMLNREAYEEFTKIHEVGRKSSSRDIGGHDCFNGPHS